MHPPFLESVKDRYDQSTFPLPLASFDVPWLTLCACAAQMAYDSAHPESRLYAVSEHVCISAEPLARPMVYNIRGRASTRVPLCSAHNAL
jgi:hypothetical protein